MKTLYAFIFVVSSLILLVSATPAKVTLHKTLLPKDFADTEAANVAVTDTVYAYDFEAKTMDGKSLNLADFRGKWVFIDFFATWWGGCVAEFPRVAQLDTKIPSLNVIAVSFDSPEDKGKVKTFMTEQKASFPVIIADDQTEEIVKLYSIQFIPFSVLVNPEGRIVFKALRGDDMYKTIKDAMGIK